MKRVYFDLETSGLSPYSEITQIAAIAVDWHTSEKSVFETKLKFDVERANERALEINHYSPEAWADAPAQAKGLELFANFLRNHTTLKKYSKRGNIYMVAQLVGHNAAAFDFPILSNSFRRNKLFLPADYHIRDTLQLAFIYSDLLGVAFDDYKLVTFAKYFNCLEDNAHDALVDVKMCAEIDRCMMQSLSDRLESAQVEACQI